MIDNNIKSYKEAGIHPFCLSVSLPEQRILENAQGAVKFNPLALFGLI